MKTLALTVTLALVSSCTAPAPTAQRAPSEASASASNPVASEHGTGAPVLSAGIANGPDAGEPLPPTDPALAAVMRRAPEPWEGACHGSTFTKFHVWNQTSPLEDLYAAIWMIKGEQTSPPMSLDDPRAEHARCIAIGPHSAFNPMNWCCR